LIFVLYRDARQNEIQLISGGFGMTIGAVMGMSMPAWQGGDIALGLGAVVIAYTVFTLVGFGSALVASAPLAQVMPVAQVIPLLALLDCGGASMRAGRAWSAVAWPAFRLLLPGMLIGQLLGVFVLSRLPAAVMAMALGAFIIILGMRGLFVRKTGKVSTKPALLHGVFGGVLGGLFGSGGFVYAAYLERHVETKEGFQATQALLIALSTAWRVVLCVWIGVLDLQVLLLALALVPAMGLGIWVGHHIDLRMSREQLFKLLNWLLVVSGAVLILRFV
jgi:uncharacterized protein